MWPGPSRPKPQLRTIQAIAMVLFPELQASNSTVSRTVENRPKDGPVVSLVRSHYILLKLQDSDAIATLNTTVGDRSILVANGNDKQKKSKRVKDHS